MLAITVALKLLHVHLNAKFLLLFLARKKVELNSGRFKNIAKNQNYEVIVLVY